MPHHLPPPCLPLPPLVSPSHPLSPSSLLEAAHVSRAEIFPSRPIFLPLPLFSPSRPSPTPAPYRPSLFTFSAPSLTLQSFWRWVSNRKCVFMYRQANSDGSKISDVFNIWIVKCKTDRFDILNFVQKLKYLKRFWTFGSLDFYSKF